MPFTYRDKPRLSERLRGKSGEEILNELKSDLDKDRRMFFDSPSWGTRENITAFPRGFPFDEDRGRRDFKSYFNDIATRHPEFADHLKDPDWCDDFGSSFGRKRTLSNSGQKEQQNQPSGSSDQPANQPQEEEEPRSQNLNQFGLRNTVPLAQNSNSEEERKQRSMSAPPDNRTSEKPKRFVTKCEIPMHDPTQDQTGKPPMAPKTSNSSINTEQAQKSSQPNVRVIPIQVEGRDEPVINTNIDTSANFAGETFRDPVFEGRLPRDFGSYRQHSPRFSKRERMSPQPSQAPPAHPHPHPQTPPHPHSQPQQTQVPHPPSTDETDSRPKPQPPKPEPKDPLTKIQVVQKEVEELFKEVEAFEGTSRKDKQYMILDELLTRKLISLDDIDTEGKENIRQARKDTIRSIQKCISLLESKVPIVESSESNQNDEGNTEEMKTEESAAATVEQPMEVDQSKQEVDQNKQSMDVDQTKNDTPSEEPLAKKEKIDETNGGSKEEQTMEVEPEKSAQEQSDEVK